MKIENILLPWDVDLLPQKKLLAGELTCMYESGSLRNIKCGETEILRRVYSALRNEHWDTIPYTIIDERIDEKENGFFISYTAIYQQGDISYKAFFEIEGRPDSTISFLMKGEALSSFMRNRIGLCVLHPIKECADRAVEVQQPDDMVFHSIFPRLISPQQPFVNVKGMKWTTADDLQIELKLDGDIFETEDQRNWTDSSYKTYSTPLSLPFPVTVMKGAQIRQQVSLSVNTGKKNLSAVGQLEDEITKIPFPKIGYSFSRVSENLTAADISLLKKIPLSHLRIDLDLSETDWPGKLQAAVKTAGQLDTKLELIVFFGSTADEQASELIERLADIHERVISILVLQKGSNATPMDLLAGVYEKIKKNFSSILVGYGTSSHFADLNRRRPALNSSFDFISFSLQPQVHASDARSIFENLDNQADTIITAKAFAPGKPVHISIQFGDRGNTGENKAGVKRNGSFAALWALLSIQNLAEASLLSLYELKADTGIAGHNGQLSPVYEALARIGEFRPLWIIKRYKGDVLLTDGLLLENKDGKRLFFEPGKPA